MINSRAVIDFQFFCYYLAHINGVESINVCYAVVT